MSAGRHPDVLGGLDASAGPDASAGLGGPGGDDLASLAGTDAATALRRAVAPISGSGALAILGATGAFAGLVAGVLAQELAPVEDRRVFVPAGARWTRVEVDEVLSAARLAPRTRSVLVLHDVDRLAFAGVARLLKTLEEPSATVLFILAAPARATLPDPLRGRLDAVVHLPLRSRSEVTRRLVGAGAAPESVERLLDLCDPTPELAEVLAAGREAKVAKLVAELDAVLALDVDASPGAVDLASLARPSWAELRHVVLDVALTRFESAARAKLAAGDPDGLALVAALTRARSLAERNASTASVLLAALTRGPVATR